ncbi:hypothetical protein [Maribellus sediminis]|uniref:hypothetical protein n=1 Tax=Maribellus sediminis TaxID=2696285 RepID=UPI00143057FC|nr:hypothetical protein [Maribellus sediminis]
MDGIKYITDEAGRRIAVQIDLEKHKQFIEDYLDFIEDENDVRNVVNEPLIPLEEVISKFEKLHGEKL